MAACLLSRILIQTHAISAMSSYRLGETLHCDPEAGYVQYELGQAPMEKLLEEKFHVLCIEEGIKRVEMTPIQRLFLTHYRCPTCKLLPLYHLDLSHFKKVRCGKCGHLVSFTNGGKYGKMRKKLALVLWQARGRHDVS
jgi:hypothetical protein